STTSPPEKHPRSPPPRPSSAALPRPRPPSAAPPEHHPGRRRAPPNPRPPSSKAATGAPLPGRCRAAPRATFLSALATASHPPTFLSTAGRREPASLRRLHLCARPRQASTAEPPSSPRLAAVSRCRPASFFSAPNRLEVCDPDHIFTGHGPMDPVSDPSSSLPEQHRAHLNRRGRALSSSWRSPARASSAPSVVLRRRPTSCSSVAAPVQLGRGPHLRAGLPATACLCWPPSSSAMTPQPPASSILSSPSIVFCFFYISLGHIAAVLLGHQCVAAGCPVHRRSLLAVRWHEARGRMCSAVLFALPRCSSPADVLTIQDQLHPSPHRRHAVQYVGARSTPHRRRAVQSVCASSTPPIPKPISLPPHTRSKRSLAHQAAGGLRRPRPDQVARSLPLLRVFICTSVLPVGSPA
uniref:Uncharacterized protein n=2 Tax=Aegilops tauschii subsp. strangulata TaxID=200361 RepID=A0A453BA66_AEGTS